jgi:hypothetical protein
MSASKGEGALTFALVSPWTDAQEGRCVPVRVFEAFVPTKVKHG